MNLKILKIIEINSLTLYQIYQFLVLTLFKPKALEQSATLIPSTISFLLAKKSIGIFLFFKSLFFVL